VHPRGKSLLQACCRAGTDLVQGSTRLKRRSGENVVWLSRKYQQPDDCKMQDWRAASSAPVYWRGIHASTYRLKDQTIQRLSPALAPEAFAKASPVYKKTNDVQRDIREQAVRFVLSLDAMLRHPVNVEHIGAGSLPNNGRLAAHPGERCEETLLRLTRTSSRVERARFTRGSNLVWYVLCLRVVRFCCRCSPD
jgi:hypothetical protein